MLGKLIKYEFKALNRFLIVVHAFLLLAAILGRFLLTSKITFISSSQEFDTNSMLLMLSIILFTLIFMGASFATFIIIAVRFYKSMYSDEGYLSHTLPVSRGQHLLAKTISGSIWTLIDMILIALSLGIVIATPAVLSAYHTNKAEILLELRQNELSLLSSLAIVFCMLMIIGCIGGVITTYASITCGQLFSTHRVLGAIVAYFTLQTAMSIIAALLMTICGYFNATIYYETGDSISQFLSIMLDTLILSAALTVVVSIILYVSTYLLLKKKVNLQ